MKKIILIEDESSVVSFIKKGLQELGYEITVALDGATGIKLVDDNDFDIIILDIMLPDINGLKFVKKSGSKIKPYLFYF